jgi:hypothetical protein
MPVYMSVRVLVCSFLAAVTLFVAIQKAPRNVSLESAESRIRSLEREKMELIYLHAKDRFETLLGLHGGGHKDTKEAELKSGLALRDLEMAKIREGME